MRVSSLNSTNCSIMAPQPIRRLCLLLFLVAASFETIQGEQDCVLMCDEGTVCVTQAMHCDGYPDCMDLSDEENCRNGCSGLLCSNRECIQPEQHCDGHIDCSDSSDEKGCTKGDYKKTHDTLPDEELCVKPCLFGKCVFDTSVKDPMAYCHCDSNYFGDFCEKDYFHESLKATDAPAEVDDETTTVGRHDSSQNEKFLCESSQKPISIKARCNGKVECDDSSDESNCTLSDYRRFKGNLLVKDLCLMPCGRGKCLFDYKDHARCKCPRNLNGTFCELNKFIKQTPKVTSQTTDVDPSTPTSSSARPETVTSVSQPTVAPISHPTVASDLNGRADQTDKPTTTDPMVDSSHPIETKGTPSDVLPEAEEESSNFFSVVLVPLLVVVAIAVVLWLLMVKPWKTH